ncbi:MAG TPA: methylated-DNA--[protein]-cysteine S-methyltransferase [Chitinophagales bacterium]|nr:methylated-DNA--[protein]-cysteine S-methyltransferase [Chitinophagales bacterium]
MQIHRINPKEIQSLKIQFSFQKSPFGKMIIANTEKGICYAAFEEEEENQAIQNLKNRFPSAEIINKSHLSHNQFLQIFQQNHSAINFDLHLKGTDFQVKVWEDLLKIPFGSTSTYGRIAQNIQLTIKASRAVGTAIGNNPIAYVIPCHRVIQSSGGLGGYMWGIDRKREILEFEKSISSQIELKF